MNFLIKTINVFVVIIPMIVLNYQFEVPKVFAFLTLNIFLVIVLLLNIKKIIFSKKDYYYLLWLLIILISGLISSNPIISILGGSYRHQGLIFFFGLYLLIKYVEILTKHQKSSLYKLAGVVVLIQAIVVISGLKIGTIGEINAVSGFLAIGTCFVMMSFPKLLLVFPAVAMMINFSKSGLLALTPYLFKNDSLVLLPKQKVKLFLLLSLIVLFFIIKPVNNSSDYESRGVIWKYAIGIIQDKPILGHGAESNEAQYDKKFLEDKIILTNLMIDRAHNLFLDITIWSGLIGLYLFVMFLYESFKNLNIERKQVFLSFLIYSMFQPLSVVHWILFALIV